MSCLSLRIAFFSRARIRTIWRDQSAYLGAKFIDALLYRGRTPRDDQRRFGCCAVPTNCAKKFNGDDEAFLIRCLWPIV